MKYGGEGSNEFNQGYEQCQEDLKVAPYPDWSIRAGVFLETVMDALQAAEEMSGLKDIEYVHAMNHIATVCRRRADACIARMLAELDYNEEV